jgi:hypothetical protein
VRKWTLFSPVIVFLGLAIVMLSSDAQARNGFPDKMAFRGWEFRTTYALYLSCVDNQIKLGKTYTNSVGPCKRERDKYINEVLAEIKRRGGWSRLDKSVKPAMESKLHQQTVQIFNKLYGIRK